MQLSRRTLLSGLTAGLALPAFRPDALRRVVAASAAAAGRDAAGLAADESYWSEIQRAFDADRTLVNLNNGGCSPTPSHVLEAMIRDLRFSNEMPVYHMWTVLEPRIESVRRDLAAEFGCDPEEMAITRNASESMETLILGLDLAAGDEVVVTQPELRAHAHDAGSSGAAPRRRGQADLLPRSAALGGRHRRALPPRDDAAHAGHRAAPISPTSPVRSCRCARSCDMARERGIEVFVDGAHAFAHFPFRRDDLDCDYYGTSLHKWLLAPIGTGFLYVRKEKQKKIWPLMAAPATMDEDVRKYEEIGTHPAANHNAIAGALAFHRGIGGERKAARLRLLRDRWAKRLLAADPRVKVLTPLNWHRLVRHRPRPPRGRRHPCSSRRTSGRGTGS